MPGDPTSHGRHCRKLCAVPSPLHDMKWVTPNMQHATRRAACHQRASTPPGVQHATRHAACHQQAACDQYQHATRRRYGQSLSDTCRYRTGLMTSAVLSLMYMGIQKGKTVLLTNQPICDQPITSLVSPTNQPPQWVGWSNKSWLVTNDPPGHQQYSSPVGHRLPQRLFRLHQG